LWPQKRWKQIILLLAILLILALVVFGVFGVLLVTGVLNREIVSEVEVISTDGDKAALIVYQPGFSSFPRDVSYAFADGLASSGWRVKITTASPQTPTDLLEYSLLTLAYPVYGGNPGTAIISYMNRLSDLNGTNIVVIACGGGDSGEIENPLSEEVQAVNGTFCKGLSFSFQDSNSIEGARQAGSSITH